MRIYLPGEDTRVDSLKQLLLAAGHELTPTVATAEAFLCCQLMAVDKPVFRFDTEVLLMKEAREMTGPVTVCLVSFEPNLLWPANYCHICEGTLRGNTAFKCPMTRAHFRSKHPEKSSDLVLGADLPAAAEMLQQIFGSISDLPSPLAMETVYAAESIAEKVLSSP